MLDTTRGLRSAATRPRWPEGVVAPETRAYRDAVLLNSAAALMVAGHASDWYEGVEEAAEAIDKGLANALLNCWIAF